MRITNINSLCKVNFFRFEGSPNIESKKSYVVFNCCAWSVQMFCNLYKVTWRFDSTITPLFVIINFRRSTRIFVIFQREISTVKFFKPILIRAIRQTINTINFTYLFVSLSHFFAFMWIKKQNVQKMLIFALHVKTDRNLIVVNEIIRNSYLYQPKDIDYWISKEKKNSNIDKRITKQT